MRQEFPRYLHKDDRKLTDQLENKGEKVIAVEQSINMCVQDFGGNENLKDFGS